MYIQCAVPGHVLYHLHRDTAARSSLTIVTYRMVVCRRQESGFVAGKSWKGRYKTIGRTEAVVNVLLP